MDALAEALLVLEEDVGSARILRVAGGTAGVYSKRSPVRVTPNEDAAAVIPCGDDCVVLAVADGVGGRPSGGTAAAAAVRALKKSLEVERTDGSQLRTAILDGIEAADRAVQDDGQGAAATLAVVQIESRRMRGFHVGDCEVLVLGQRGKLKLQTVAHSPVGFAREAGMLDDDEALHHEDRHLVSNVIGAADMRIEVGAWMTLAPFDTVIVTSDGLPDNLSTEEIVEAARKGPLAKVVDALAASATRRMLEPVSGAPSKPDDLTFIVFRPGRSAAAAGG